MYSTSSLHEPGLLNKLRVARRSIARVSTYGRPLSLFTGDENPAYAAAVSGVYGRAVLPRRKGFP
jgi:hypothetical protein